MNRSTTLERLHAAVDRAWNFRGWDLSSVAPRLLGMPVPWDYESLARAVLSKSASALDMGTGGGELLSTLAPHPSLTVATEGWPPNVPIAAARLRPYGISVVAASSLVLPFRDNVFDVVLNRHEELDPSEVARILVPGGQLITQQVDEENWRELIRYFPRKRQLTALFQTCVDGLSDAGLVIEVAKRHEYPTAYSGVEDIAYLLTIAPWTVPEFDVERDLDALLALERDCTKSEGLVLTEARFLIIARNL